MAVYRVMNIQSWIDSLPEENVSNTMHFLTNTSLSEGDLDDLAQDVATAFQSLAGFNTRGHHAKVYNIEDTKPRPIVGEYIVNPTGSIDATGNRDVACCVSFYSGRNLPRQRGRLYLGPVSSSEAGNHRPSSTLRSQLGAVPVALAAAGPANCQWAIYSTVDHIARAVTNWYIDDEWDTQRKRGRKATSRLAASITA